MPSINVSVPGLSYFPMLKRVVYTVEVHAGWIWYLVPSLIFSLYIPMFWSSWLMNQLWPSEKPWAAWKLGYTWPRCYHVPQPRLVGCAGNADKWNVILGPPRRGILWLQSSWAGKEGLSLGEEGRPEDVQGIPVFLSLFPYRLWVWASSGAPELSSSCTIDHG